MLVEHKLELFSSFDERAYHEYRTKFSSLFQSNWEGERETDKDPNDIRWEGMLLGNYWDRMRPGLQGNWAR